ncbi:MAG: NAD(P)/FAD-dependent oxidoreductase [Myxococcales bacterium]|nr:NAD(P)/FAD-dependent oxidoreductase [Myxococcales bacterium]
MHFDVCVIGAGPAGYAAAIRAWDYGKRVCIVERGLVGGAGVHHGALTSKTLWELSRDYRRALVRDRGFVAENVVVDYQQVVHCVDTAADEKVAQLERQLKVLREPHEGHQGSITTLEGTARFVDARTIAVEGTDPGEAYRLTADNIVIATGSRPRIVDNIPVDGNYVLTSDHLTRLKRFPRSIVIVGAGVIGCEFATILSNFGQTKVYLIDRADRILPFEDHDVASLCAANLEARGVTIHRKATLDHMTVNDGMVEYCIRHASGGLETIRVERALISIGRVPNTRGLDLHNAGIALTPRGHIEDDDTRTSVSHIYAVGDVTLDIAVVSIGEIEGRRAIDHMYGEVPAALSYENISAIMFLDPEVASVGLNELQAQRKRVPYKVAVYSYALVNRAIAMRATQGFVKILVSNDDEMRVLGIRALGAHASTSIEAVSLMIRQNRSVRELAELLHPHPAVTEALQDCVRMLLGTSIMKPHVFTNELRLSAVTYDAEGMPKQC